MNSDEAKYILQAYRPGGQDANDPHFAEALALAKADPELGKWFADQVAFDGTMSRKLGELRPPAQLKRNILAGNHVIEPAFWSKRRVWQAMAASLIFFTVLTAILLENRSYGNRPDFADYRRQMMQATVVDDRHLDIKTADTGKIHDWFASHQATADFPLPAGLRGVPSMGCRVLDWQGRKVSMLCYLLNGTNHVDMFVVSGKGLRGAPAQETPQFVSSGQKVTAAWRQAGNVYLLIGQGDEELFRKSVQAAPFTGQRFVWNKSPDAVSNLCMSQPHESAMLLRSGQAL